MHWRRLFAPKRDWRQEALRAYAARLPVPQQGFLGVDGSYTQLPDVFACACPWGDYRWDLVRVYRALWRYVHPLIVLSPAHLAPLTARAQVDPHGVAEASVWMPGVLAPYFDWEVERFVHVLIDGNHRATRALQRGQPFQVWELSKAESLACLIQHSFPTERGLYGDPLTPWAGGHPPGSTQMLAVADWAQSPSNTPG